MALDVVYATNNQTQKVSLDRGGINAIVGNLYTYDKNADDEYTLTPAIVTPDAENVKDSGFDNVYKGGIDKDKDLNSSGKVKYLNKMSIDNDAVIFLHHGESSFKVISGAQLKTTDGSKITEVIAYYNNDSSVGKTVQVAYVTMSQKVQSADSTYGYVLADAASTRNSSNEKCYELKVWTKDGEKTYLTDGNAAKFAVSQGAVIKYTVNSDNEIDDITLTIKTGSTDPTGIQPQKDTDNTVIGYYGLVPIVAKDGDNLQFVVDGDRFSIEKDTVILYVDNDKVVGSTEGSVITASENPEGGHYTNAVFYSDSATDGEIDLLVIDINNDMQGEM